MEIFTSKVILALEKCQLEADWNHSIRGTLLLELVTREFEDIDLCYKTFISWYEQNDLSRMFEFCNPTYEFPILQKISIPTKIIVGSEDEYFHQSNSGHPEEAIDLMIDKIPHAEGKILY